MENPELSISVGELIGIPRVTLRGIMDGWHDQAVLGILSGYQEEGTGSIVLDLAGLRFAGADGATAIVNVLRSIGPGMCVHVVAPPSGRNMLELAKFGPCIKLYSSTDEIAEYVSPNEELLTSRWLSAATEDEELPLAA
jgi:anti-anti-sigma regulatory factor